MGRTVLESINSTTTGLRNLDINRYLAQEIPTPDPDEQRRIADILDKADAIRRKRQDAIKLSEDFLRSVFLDMFGDPVTNPKGWEIANLEDLCSDVVDCPHSTPKYEPIETSFACVRSSDIQDGYLDWTTTKYVNEEEFTERIKRTVPTTGDVIYCREGARFGNAARVLGDKRICLGQRMMLLRSDREMSTPEFVWSFLSSPNTYQQVSQQIGGSASPHLNVRDVKGLATILPPLHLQQKYSKIVHIHDSRKSSCREFEKEIGDLFNSLIQRAFRGEL